MKAAWLQSGICQGIPGQIFLGAVKKLQRDAADGRRQPWRGRCRAALDLVAQEPVGRKNLEKIFKSEDQSGHYWVHQKYSYILAVALNRLNARS